MNESHAIDLRKQEAHAAATQALNVAVGEQIRRVRMERGIGQAECARAAGLDTSSMFRIEAGKQNLTLQTLGRLAVGLGVSMDRLVSGVVPGADIVVARPRR